MVPAQERLAAADGLGPQVDERLVEQLELPVGESLAQIEFERACSRASISRSKTR